MKTFSEFISEKQQGWELISLEDKMYQVIEYKSGSNIITISKMNKLSSDNFEIAAMASGGLSGSTRREVKGNNLKAINKALDSATKGRKISFPEVKKEDIDLLYKNNK